MLFLLLLLEVEDPKVMESLFLSTGSSLARAWASARALILMLAASSARVTRVFTILISWSSHHLYGTVPSFVEILEILSTFQVVNRR